MNATNSVALRASCGLVDVMLELFRWMKLYFRARARARLRAGIEYEYEHEHHFIEHDHNRSKWIIVIDESCPWCRLFQRARLRGSTS